jgi:AcrR family transcriptional regulator
MAHEKRVAVSSPRSRSGTSVRAVRRPESGEAQSTAIKRILDGARDVLVRHGHAGFTTRRVAEAAKMRPGNLAYHFPSKRELLRALIARILDQYSEAVDAALSQHDIPRGQELQNLVQYLMTDSVASSTVRISRELWAMSLHDELVRREVDDFYDEIMERAAQMLRRSRPRAKVAAIRELIHILTMMVVGSSVLHGLRPNRSVSLARSTDLVTWLIQNINR